MLRGKSYRWGVAVNRTGVNGARGVLSPRITDGSRRRASLLYARGVHATDIHIRG